MGGAAMTQLLTVPGNWWGRGFSPTSSSSLDVLTTEPPAFEDTGAREKATPWQGQAVIGPTVIIRWPDRSVRDVDIDPSVALDCRWTVSLEPVTGEWFSGSWCRRAFKDRLADTQSLSSV